MPPKKSPQQKLVDILPPASQVIVNQFLRYQHLVTCTYCTKVGTLHYTHNTTIKDTVKPVFQCDSCKQTPILQNIEREVNQAMSQPGAGEAVLNASTSVTVPHHAKKRNRIHSDSSEQTTTQNPAASPMDTDKVAQLEATVQSLQDKIVAMESNTQLLIQQLIQQNTMLQQQLHTITKSLRLDDINRMVDEEQHGTTAPSDSRVSKWAQSQAGPSTSTADSTANSTNINTSSTTTPTNTNQTKTNNIKQKTQKNTTTNLNTNSKQKTKPSYRDIVLQKAQAQKKQQAITKNINIATRAFTVTPPESQGFQYIFFPAKNRISRKMQRKNLRALGVDNGRVLDITYPAKTIIGLLVHNLYVDELIQTMATAGVHHITYDPQDGANLTNPEYDHLSSEEKNQIAITKHNHRLNRALPHIRLPVSKTIALFFHTKGWITDEQLTTHIAFCDEQIQTQRNKKHKGKQSTTTTSTRTPPPAKPAVASTATDNQMDTTEDMPVTVDGNTNTATTNSQ